MAQLQATAPLHKTQLFDIKLLSPFEGYRNASRSLASRLIGATSVTYLLAGSFAVILSEAYILGLFFIAMGVSAYAIRNLQQHSRGLWLALAIFWTAEVVTLKVASAGYDFFLVVQLNAFFLLLIALSALAIATYALEKKS
jgi:hypothetical protein